MNTSVEFQARNVQFLEFELNNQCQYAKEHTWCPRHILGTSPYIELPTWAIRKVTQFFEQYDFSGSVYLSCYNEPTLDFRFFNLIRLCKRELPQCTVQMYTNALGLTYARMKKYLDAGIGIMRISLYSDVNENRKKYKSFANRLKGEGYTQKIHIEDRTKPGWLGYDDRISLYRRENNTAIDTPCYHPIVYFMVACNGEVMLCWDDWKQKITFGNVYTNSIEDILMSEKRLHYIEHLKKDRRIFPCIGCDRPTELCISEYRDRLKL